MITIENSEEFRKSLNQRILKEYHNPESKKDIELCVKKTLKNISDLESSPDFKNITQINVRDI